MALGNVFIRDVDGNIPYDTGSSNEKVTGLLFDVSLQPELFTEGYGKTNESKLKPGDVPATWRLMLKGSVYSLARIPASSSL